MFRKYSTKKPSALPPSWSLDDPTPRIVENSYTFFVPPPEMLDLLAPGDVVKLIFRSIPVREKWNAEKMWVEITQISGDHWVGKLNNHPDDMPQLKAGDEVRFERKHIIDFEVFPRGRLTADQLAKLPKPAREFWDRCFVDKCVLHDGVKVGFIYREVPEPYSENEKFKDSGWRIRGDHRGLTEEEYSNREVSYVALGAVLNKDDSWLHLIDEEVGCSYTRDFETNKYVRTE